MSSRESCIAVHNTLKNNHSLEPRYFIPLHQQSNLQQTKIYEYTAEIMLKSYQRSLIASMRLVRHKTV